MKPVITRLYGLLVVLSLAGLVAWSWSDWSERQRAAQASVQQTLRKTAGTVSELTIRGAWTAEQLNRVFGQMAGSDGRWKMVLLASEARGTEYYRGPRPSVAVDRAVPHWEAKTWSEVAVRIPVFQPQGTPLYLEAIYEFYGRSELFSLLKATGIVLLVLLILTSLLVFVASRESPPSAEEEESGEPSLDLDPGPFEPDLEASPSLEIDFDHQEPSEASDEYWFDENLTLDDLPPLEDLPPLDDALSAPMVEDEVRSESPSPSLFSPETGLSWESFLKQRLNHELERSASQNQDLSLILLAMKKGTVEAAVWGAAILEAFPSADLDFEYEGGAAVVLSGRSLEGALKAARAFVESADRTWPGVVLHAGVASRAGRLVSAETLLAEADSARRRSLSGTVRVLGLKTDPDRYREHLASASA